MIILAYDVQGVILCHFVLHGEIVNAEYYAAYLQNVIILLDNTTPHKAICVRDLL